MLPTAGYFRTIPCPFYTDDKPCRRPYCHFKHIKHENQKSKEVLPGYKPTPISQLNYQPSNEEDSFVPSYNPTPIVKTEAADENIDFSLIDSMLNPPPDPDPEPVKEKHHKKSKKSSSSSSSRSRDDKSKSSSSRYHKSESKDREKDRKKQRKSDDEEHRHHRSQRSSSSSDEKHHSKRSKKSEETISKTSKTDIVPDSVDDFLKAMDEIDKKLEKESPKKKPKSSSSSSFLSAISKPDKMLIPKVKTEEEGADSEVKKKTRISYVKQAESGMSSAMIARKRQSNNPVQAMLNRFNAVRKESQTKDIEDQLSLITGEDPQQPSTSKKGSFEPLEGLRKGKVQRKAHIVTNVSTLRRPVIDSESAASKVPTNIRQKYLDTLVDECLKIYPNNTAAAYQRAEDEEKGCAEKSKTRSIYLNSVVMCIKRLRNEGKEVNPGAKKAVEFKNTTPNMLTTHLQTLLGKAGTIGSWSIEDKMKNIPELTSEILYKMLLRYVLNEEQLESNGYPIPVNLTKSLEEAKFDQLERTCSRCNKGYQVNVDGHQVVKEDCIFHWSRIRKTRGLRGTGVVHMYPCCNGEATSDGCSVNAYHITNDVDPRGFVKTLASEDSNKKKVYALDCEMCYTTRGIELTRITVIDDTGETAYESFVKPDNKILDYNTRFSGVTEQDLKAVTTSIRDVQAVLLSMFSSQTILCGHSLDSDLKALKLIHTCVVDTSITYPHKMGPPFKRALRNLTSEHLHRIIQEDVGGHDSKEDALAALDLMKHKVKQDLKKL